MSGKIKKFPQRAELPSFNNPPINEVVCGMRFHPTDKLRIPHIGLLWNKFRADYPILQHAQIISTTRSEIPIDRATGVPIPRVWFINVAGDQLIQFQNDRFYFNWRKKETPYPRYQHIIDNFETVSSAVTDLFKEFDLGVLEPMEYELSYINHIPRGIGWEALDDLPEVFTDFIWNAPAERFLPYPEQVSWLAEFSLPEQKGQLIISLKQAIRIDDELPVLVYELKAIGVDREKVARNWFDLAHEWLVLGFADLTTDKMHKIWEVEENA